MRVELWTGLDHMRNLPLKQCIHITAKRYAKRGKEGRDIWGNAKMEEQGRGKMQVTTVLY